MSTALFAGDFDLKNAISHPQNWKLVDWDSPEVLEDPDWEVVEKYQKNDRGFILVGRQEAPAVSSPKATFLRWQSESSKLDAALQVTHEIGYEDCSKVAASIGKELGVAVESDETTRMYFSENNFIELSNKEWQWTVGSTRITADCGGMKSFGGKDSSSNAVPFSFLSVNYESVKTRSKLEPPFLLRCNQEIEFMQGRTKQASSDLVFWVSLSRPLFRTTGLSVIGDPKSHMLDDFRFSFKIKRKSFSTTYRVDRVTGELSADVMEGDKKVATVRGNCQKESSQKKF